MASESWKTVAQALADRMVDQADNCPAGKNAMGEKDEELYGPLHHPPEDFSADCPYCADTVAYRRYLTKIRSVR